MKTILLLVALFFVNFYTFSQEDNFVTDVKYIQEIVVKSSSTQAALDLYSENILDYRVYGRDILTLKKKKRKYLIGIEYAEKEAENYLVDIDKPRLLVTDCMNNAFILNDDYAYQFVITDKIEIISILTLEVFYSNVSSCVGNFDDAILVRSFTNYNKGYQLELYNKDTKKKDVVYQVIDTLSLNNYIDIVNPNQRLGITTNSQMRIPRISHNFNRGDRYNQKSRDPSKAPVGFDDVYYSTNRSLMKSFYGTPSANRSVQSKSYLGSEYFYNDAFFKSIVDVRNYFNMMLIRNMYNERVKINTFKLNEKEFVIIDQLSSTVSVYAKEGELKSQSKLDFENKIIEMKQDPYTNDIYFTSKTENLFKVHRLNVSDGTMHYVGGFKNIMLARSIKIFDGWIYYRVMKNDYFKLYRTRLRS